MSDEAKAAPKAEELAAIRRDHQNQHDFIKSMRYKGCRMCALLTVCESQAAQLDAVRKLADRWAVLKPTDGNPSVTVESFATALNRAAADLRRILEGPNG
jgi:hypothetical protein